MRSLRILGLFVVLVGGFYVVMSVADTSDKSDLADNQFMVITVQGKIVYQKTGSEMNRGDTYLKGTPLEFITKQSRAAIANKRDGRFVITGNKKGKVSMLPAANPISSRAGGITNIVDLKQYFEGRLMIVDQMKVFVSKDGFPQSDSTYFYVKYEHSGEIIPKKLAHDGDRMIIDKKELFKVDGKEIPVEEKEMTLYYKGADKSYKINKFTPVFPEKEGLRSEVELLLKAGEYQTAEDKYNAVNSFVYDFYGRPDRKNLTEWLENEFK